MGFNPAKATGELRLGEMGRQIGLTVVTKHPVRVENLVFFLKRKTA